MAIGGFGSDAFAPLGWGLAYVAGGWAGTRAAATELAHLRVDIDLLMILAALGALVIDAPLEGATLLFLFSLSNVLQQVATARSRDAIRGLMELRPEVARVRRDGGVVDVPLEEVEVGEEYLVGPGDRIPLDGEVVQGRSEVDQSSLTGESVPVLRQVGDAVLAGTINTGGALDVRTTRRASDSALARMVALVEEAQAEKAETQRIIDRWEQPYALGVIGLTIIAIVVPVVLLSRPFDPSFYRAMTLMVAASPCALVISTPAAVLSGIAAGARNGVLFKGGVFIESFATVRAVAFDKTGTLTRGSTELAEIVPVSGVDSSAVLEAAAAVQTRSEHHLAAATMRAAAERGSAPAPATDFRAQVGRGVEGRVGSVLVRVGNPEHFREARPEPWTEALSAVGELRSRGQTAVIVAADKRVLGVMGFTDQLRAEAAATIRALRERGIEDVVMLTGDHTDVAERVAAAVGIEHVRAEILPDRKVEEVRRLRDAHGAVAMVGDGVNDAAALAAATVGVAMGGAGTDVALESADLVLMSDDLGRLPWALDLSRRTRRTLLQNLVISLGMIVLMVGTILTVGLPLPLAVLGHEGSTVVVALNGLRLLTMPSPATAES
jgi:Cd2+/Zn2+-exporting ATPase